jgi:hypothetical protein
MPIIGRSTLVTVAGITDVPAKVDTGADSSSIWVTKLSEHGGMLEFTLFGPSSPYYTGQPIRTNEFALTTVSSSNGHTQQRYVVNLELEIAGVRHIGRFTLADRFSMSYPILLGRKFLHNTFMVDVTKGLDADIHHQLLQEREHRLQSEQN